MPNFARDDADMSVFNRSKKGRHKYAQSQQHYWIKRSQSQRRRLGHGGIARIVPCTHLRRRALAAVLDGRDYRVRFSVQEIPPSPPTRRRMSVVEAHSE